MKLKYIFIIIGSMLLLLGLMTFIIYPNRNDKEISMVISVISLGILLTGIFWKKQ